MRDVDITFRVLDIAMPGTNYEDGSTQGLNKLDPQETST
jgi:hypothetical protein